jgi:hypothetical protein
LFSRQIIIQNDSVFNEFALDANLACSVMKNLNTPLILMRYQLDSIGAVSADISTGSTWTGKEKKAPCQKQPGRTPRGG